MTMQQPTLKDVHIRSAADAHKLFYAVQCGKLPKIEKRLDANERAALRPGDVYVWEEKGPNTDSFSVSMERFTEGKSWTASRVREDFLMYFENPRKGKGNVRTSENQVVRAGEQDLYIKLTYSVIREDVGKDPSQSNDCDDKQKKPPKWHMNAYYTKLTEGQLRTIDDIPDLRDLVVPDGIFRSARTTKPGKRGEGSRNATSTVKRMYAPFPSRRVRDSPPPAPAPPMPDIPPASVSLVTVPPLVAPPNGSISLHPPIPPVQTFYTEQSSLASALSHPAELKPSFALVAPAAAYVSAIPPAPVLHPSPQCGWGQDPTGSAVLQTRAANSNSPASSERSVRSARSVHTPLHMSPSLSSASTSSQESPMLMTTTPPLWDNGEPYKPAPILPPEGLQGPRIDLAPLDTLPRGRKYSHRHPTDDRTLRMLASGAH